MAAMCGGTRVTLAVSAGAPPPPGAQRASMPAFSRLAASSTRSSGTAITCVHLLCALYSACSCVPQAVTPTLRSLIHVPTGGRSAGVNVAAPDGVMTSGSAVPSGGTPPRPSFAERSSGASAAGGASAGAGKPAAASASGSGRSLSAKPASLAAAGAPGGSGLASVPSQTHTTGAKSACGAPAGMDAASGHCTCSTRHTRSI